MGLFTGYDTAETTRGRFGNRCAFYMAAVGSAVGFGNVWRFPSLAAGFGGAAFLIPYGMALFFIGIPVLFLEIGFGQYHQTGDVGVFGSFNKRLRGVGIMSVICGYVLLTYYTMLISWVFNAFCDSWSEDSPWLIEGLDGDTGKGYFFNNVVGMETLDGFSATRIVPANVGYSFLTWFVTFAAIAFGPKLTGRITYFTMGFPIILLFVFLFRGVSLEGSRDGIDLYIGKRSDINVLSDQPTVWTEAVTQIFFSLSVTFGTMTAYGSLTPREEPAFLNSVVVAVANCTFSFIAGFAVFSSIGHLAHLQGVDVSEIKFTSFDLVFGTWPVVLASLPGGIHWIRFLFLNLCLLGIDSAFSILEGVITVMKDTTWFKDTPKWMVTLGFSVIGFLFSLLYALDAGLFWLDTIDYYINFMLLLVGLMETFSAGWAYNIEGQIEKVGAKSVYSFAFANFGGVTLASGLWFGLRNNVWGGFVGLICVYVIFTGLAIAFKETDTTKEALYVLYLQNVMELRDELEPVIGWVPYAWCILIKHFIPQVLLILFVNGCTAQVDIDGEMKSKFGNYEGYPGSPYQVIGILTVAMTAVAFLVGFVFPDVYKSFAIYEKSQKAKELDEKVADEEEPVKEEA